MRLFYIINEYLNITIIKNEASIRTKSYGLNVGNSDL